MHQVPAFVPNRERQLNVTSSRRFKACLRDAVFPNARSRGASWEQPVSPGVRRTIATAAQHNVRLESFGRGRVVAGLRWMWSGGKSSGGSKIQSMEVFSVLRYSMKKPPISQSRPAFSSLSPLLSSGECAAIDQKPGPFCSASD